MTRLLPLCLLFACGDDLVGTAYRGEALLSLEGPLDFPLGQNFLHLAECEQKLNGCWEEAEHCGEDECFAPCDERFEACAQQGEQADALREVQLRVGVFWSRKGAQRGADEDAVEQQALTAAGFPARYMLTLYRPPPATVVREEPSGRYALGLILVYVDHDEDGVYDAGEDQIVGGAAERALLWTEAGAKVGEVSFAAGYHRVRVSDQCAEGGAVSLEPAEESTTPLTVDVSAEFLRGLVLDEDCDGRGDDFDLCPEPDQIHLVCDEDSEDFDPGFCAFCAGYEEEECPPEEELLEICSDEEEEPDPVCACL